VTNAGSPGALAASGANGFCWNSALQTTVVKVFDTAADVTITVVD
jgi:hypothetical protein